MSFKKEVKSLLESTDLQQHQHLMRKNRKEAICDHCQSRYNPNNQKRRLRHEQRLCKPRSK